MSKSKFTLSYPDEALAALMKQTDHKTLAAERAWQRARLAALREAVES